ncbi:MAG: 4Fe-4S cluster-binding domain-containing protein [Chloroflexi bacterium]|nr:4Fe-4S cluster-binding domain-containing protein [Chloroflexota bacterium]
MTDFKSRYPSRYQAITIHNVAKQPEWQRLDPELREAVEVTARVLPFRTNVYVVRELIDWDNVPEDPMFQLTFPQPGMLDKEDFEAMRELIRRGASRQEIIAKANEIRFKLNPHPAGQMTHNVPVMDGKRLWGMQHKYRETVLFFPAQGQTCHAYCTYCFRWAQFVGIQELKFESKEIDQLVEYLKRHKFVTDVLFTGGDPMIMKAKALRQYIEPLLQPGLEHVQNIRIGTKALAYWPQRFVTDEDADEVLRIYEDVVKAGKHLAVMAHFTHPREMSTDIVREAIRRVRDTGAEIRMQAPIVHPINDNAKVWATMWREGVKLGMIPYYMFVERDTGPKNYFEVPLVKAHEIFREAFMQVSGLARTVRGPSMSAWPGKVRILGTAEVKGEKVIVLDFLQGRNPEWNGRVFFAKYDPEATWLSDLEPAFGAEKFFFEEEEPIVWWEVEKDPFEEREPAGAAIPVI